MLNPEEVAMPPTADFPMANIPYTEALVYVHHCPANPSSFLTCPASSHETW